MARRRFFAAWVEAGRAGVEGSAAAHLARVLRAQPGQEYELASAGRVYLSRITRVSARRVEFEIVSEALAIAPQPRVELATALFKFDRFEWMLEKATELGLARLHLLATRRTDPHLVAAATKRMPRWRRIVLEAAEQSRRDDWPEILPPLPLAEWLPQSHVGERVLLTEVQGALALHPGDGVTPWLLLTGPEGGWASEELTAAQAAGFAPRSLGLRILRCETAILAALARL